MDVAEKLKARSTYGDTEIGTAHTLTLERVVKALPPAGVAASIPGTELCEGFILASEAETFEGSESSTMDVAEELYSEWNCVNIRRSPFLDSDVQRSWATGTMASEAGETFPKGTSRASSV